MGSIPGLIRSPGVGNGNPLQCPGMENPWTEEPGELQSMGSQRVGHDWVTEHAQSYICVCVYTDTCIHHSGWHLKLGTLASGTTPCHLASLISFSISSAQNTMIVKVEVTQSCPTLCDPMDYRDRGILQARILECVAISFSRGIFPTQDSNPGLLHCRWILYQLSHKGSPRTQYISKNVCEGLEKWRCRGTMAQDFRNENLNITLWILSCRKRFYSHI